MRALAKEIQRSDWREWLLLNEEAMKAQDAYFEEVFLRGLIISEGKGSVWKEQLSYVSDFVPYIDNWAVCDAFCAGLKQTKMHKEEMWEFLQPYLESDKEYFLRFGVVMLLDYYIEEAYLDRLFEIFDRIHHEGYYVKMAVAWAISICYVKYPKETKVYLLENTRLDKFTYNKAIQKACESYRVAAEEKVLLRSMKRK